jgi:hypothetical protein
MSHAIPLLMTLLAAQQIPAGDPAKPSQNHPVPLIKASRPDLPKSPVQVAAEALIKEMDRNGDRLLNADEYPRNFRVNFARLDINHDGHLGAAELAFGLEKGLVKPVRRGEVIANAIYTVADDFIVEVYHNGKKVSADCRALLEEIYGATVEKINIEIREGDWVVFNVVNNQLRWGGCSYFAAAGMKANLEVGFVSEAESGRWLACDEPGEVPSFIAHPETLSRMPAQPIKAKWDQGDARMNSLTDGWKGSAVWGSSRNTWIKYVAPEPRDEAR